MLNKFNVAMHEQHRIIFSGFAVLYMLLYIRASKKSWCSKQSEGNCDTITTISSGRSRVSNVKRNRTYKQMYICIYVFVKYIIGTST